MNEEAMEKHIEKSFEDLPEEIKETLTDEDLPEDIEEIGKENGLHLDEIELLYEEVSAVLLGKASAKNFKDRITSRLAIETGVAEKVTADIDDLLFKPLRDSLQKAYGVSQTHSQENQEDDDEEIVNREDILREIENPEPISIKKFPKVEPVELELPAPTKTPEIPEHNLPSQKVSETTASKPTPTTLNPNTSPTEILSRAPINLVTTANVEETPKITKPEDKLSQVVRSTKTESSTTLSSAKREGDPYREQIDPKEQRLKF